MFASWKPIYYFWGNASRRSSELEVFEAKMGAMVEGCAKALSSLAVKRLEVAEEEIKKLGEKIDHTAFGRLDQGKVSGVPRFISFLKIILADRTMLRVIHAY